MTKSYLAGLALIAAVPCAGQNYLSEADWNFGLGFGSRINQMDFSHLDETLFPSNTTTGSGILELFAECDFGKEHRFGVRPALAFLSRGGNLTRIGEKIADPSPEDVVSGRYKLTAHYIDIRVPVLYNFGNDSWKVRPYVYLAPAVGFRTGGNVRTKIEYADGAAFSHTYKASKSNVSKALFAGAIGAGVRYTITHHGDPFLRIGIDLSYQQGFTNTFKSKNRIGEMDDNVVFYPEEKRQPSSRRLSGFELKAVISMPLSYMKRRKTTLSEREMIQSKWSEPEETYTYQPAIPDCYTLQEITEMIERGVSIEGKKICSIDDVRFDFAKSTIRPESADYLNQLAQLLTYTGHNVVIKGHTDNIGPEDVNMRLSKERVIAVKEYLVEQGVPAENITYEYYGMTRPLVSNDTPEGRRINRRVEFEF